MKYLSLLMVLFASFFALAFTPSFDPDPEIIITSPEEGQEFTGGTTITIGVNVECDCMIENLMVKLADGRETLEPVMYHESAVNKMHATQFSQSITLPTVTEEMDLELEVEIRDKTGDDLSSEQITITVLP